ncbi:5-formyltetrahydrofolate cyclo-ligase family protein [uncultured archaeon]|nr:5-formyltetrahydrofolate cyclo-ligase family protein [uncultured archaeon]
MEKPFFRHNIRAQLSKLGSKEYEARSAAICGNIQSLNEVSAAKIVAAFMPINGEPGIMPFIERFYFSGKYVCVPAMKPDGSGFDFVRLKPESVLAVGEHGVPEPVEREIVEPDKIDLFLVPGLAFDRRGVRIGRGKGHYDRFFSKAKPRGKKIGVCFDFQLFGLNLPAEGHDILMDIIVTDQKVMRP